MVGTVKKLGPPLVGTVKEEEDKSRALSVSRFVLVFWTLSLSLSGKPILLCVLLSLCSLVLLYSILPSLCTFVLFSLWFRFAACWNRTLLCVSEPSKSFCSLDNIEIGHGLFLKMFAQRALGCFDLCFLYLCFACWISEYLLSRF